MNITDEMLEAGAKLIAQEHGSTVFDDDHEVYEFTDAERSQYRDEARAVIEFAAPLIAAQALREAAMKALANQGPPVETALCVGGPRHGTDMELGEADAMKVVMPFVPRAFNEEIDVFDDPMRDRIRTYYRQKVLREIDGVRYWRRVWLFDEHRLDEAGMQRLADAVVQQWLAAGTRVSP